MEQNYSKHVTHLSLQVTLTFIDEILKISDDKIAFIHRKYINWNSKYKL